MAMSPTCTMWSETTVSAEVQCDGLSQDMTVRFFRAVPAFSQQQKIKIWPREKAETVTVE